jgi:phenylacetic acid degradation operon negative regulatory protein
MPARALVAAGALFGSEENAIRVALARLLAIGLVQRDERGQYRAGRRAGAVGSRIARWRTIEDGIRPWDGGWVGAVRVPPRSARARGGTGAARALHFLALRELAPGVYVRPDNLAGGIGAVREQLAALGLPAAVIVTGLRELDATTDARARKLWDVRRLRASYRASCAALAASEKRLPRLRPRAAMVESFLLGGRVIRQIVLDPLLPEAMVPAAERAALVAAMRSYDRAGRARWAEFMRAFEVLPAAGAPMHLHAVEEAVA